MTEEEPPGRGEEPEGHTEEERIAALVKRVTGEGVSE